jgi:hypothetical protein
MAWWTAHTRPGGGADDVVLVREGFSWWALFFPLLWLAAKGMWIVLLVALGAQLAIWALAEAAGFGDVMSFVLSCAINFIIAFEGNDLLRWTYRRRGFEPAGLVKGDNLDEAEYRFFTEVGLPLVESAMDKAPPPQPPILSSRWKPDQPDFIFPGFGR